MAAFAKRSDMSILISARPTTSIQEKSSTAGAMASTIGKRLSAPTKRSRNLSAWLGDSHIHQTSRTRVPGVGTRPPGLGTSCPATCFQLTSVCHFRAPLVIRGLATSRPISAASAPRLSELASRRDVHPQALQPGPALLRHQPLQGKLLRHDDPNARPGGSINPVTNPEGLSSNWCSATFVAKLWFTLN